MHSAKGIARSVLLGILAVTLLVGLPIAVVGAQSATEAPSQGTRGCDQPEKPDWVGPDCVVDWEAFPEVVDCLDAEGRVVGKMDVRYPPPPDLDPTAMSEAERQELYERQEQMKPTRCDGTIVEGRAEGRRPPADAPGG